MNDVFYKVTFERDEFQEVVMVHSEFPMSLDKVAKKARAKFRQRFPGCWAHIFDEYRFRSIEMI